MNKTQIITHPKCKELSGTVTRIDAETWETETAFGYKDWYDSEEEAIEYITRDNESEYNGSAGDARANENAYAQQERWATGNY